MKTLGILGSTGSIGTQALEVIEEHSDKFQVEVLTANSNADLIKDESIANISYSYFLSSVPNNTNILLYIMRSDT